jgi:hypothetical protein
MPGFLIQEGATVICAHGGQALPTVPSPDVSLDGMPASVVSDPWTVAGCPGVPAAGIPPYLTRATARHRRRRGGVRAGRHPAAADRHPGKGHRDMSATQVGVTAT